MLLRLSVSFVLLLSVACSESSAQAGDNDVLNAGVKTAAITAASTETAPAGATKGRITGMIKVEGKVEETEPVDPKTLAADPHCAELHSGRNPVGVILGEDGGLKDVFIQLTSGVPDLKYDLPEEPVVVNQIGCTYDPHVWGIMKKQELKILNSDATLHNIHSLPKSNKEFNLAMPNQGDERTQKFKKAEDAIKIKCDVHSWMATFAFVLEHPYFAVSDASGAFALNTSGLADGEYGVKIWHEVLGESEGSVTIKDGVGSFEHTYETGKE
jgi:hypothetical protein